MEIYFQVILYSKSMLTRYSTKMASVSHAIYNNKCKQGIAHNHLAQAQTADFGMWCNIFSMIFFLIAINGFNCRKIHHKTLSLFPHSAIFTKLFSFSGCTLSKVPTSNT